MFTNFTQSLFTPLQKEPFWSFIFRCTYVMQYVYVALDKSIRKTNKMSTFWLWLVLKQAWNFGSFHGAIWTDFRWNKHTHIPRSLATMVPKRSNRKPLGSNKKLFMKDAMVKMSENCSSCSLQSSGQDGQVRTWSVGVCVFCPYVTCLLKQCAAWILICRLKSAKQRTVW